MEARINFAVSLNLVKFSGYCRGNRQPFSDFILMNGSDVVKVSHSSSEVLSRLQEDCTDVIVVRASVVDSKEHIR